MPEFLVDLTFLNINQETSLDSALNVKVEGLNVKGEGVYVILTEKTRKRTWRIGFSFDLTGRGRWLTAERPAGHTTGRFVIHDTANLLKALGKPAKLDTEEASELIDELKGDLIASIRARLEQMFYVHYTDVEPKLEGMLDKNNPFKGTV